VASTAAQIRYQSREEEGTQSPRQTLDRGCGSCRDFAVLFAEAARSLGFGARLVSGYLYNPDQPLQNDAGSTHAWARALGGFNLHRPVDARGRHVLGVTDAYLGMSVEVEVMAQ
jgi:transglutaminase-like putative cysteine protease